MCCSYPALKKHKVEGLKFRTAMVDLMHFKQFLLQYALLDMLGTTGSLKQLVEFTASIVQ